MAEQANDERLQALEQQVTALTSYAIRITGFLSSVYTALPDDQRAPLKTEHVELAASLRDLVSADDAPPARPTCRYGHGDLVKVRICDASDQDSTTPPGTRREWSLNGVRVTRISDSGAEVADLDDVAFGVHLFRCEACGYVEMLDAPSTPSPAISPAPSPTP